MLDDVRRLQAKYREEGALVDANLLLLVAIGLYDRRRIPSFKRTAAFTPDEFDLLQAFLSPFTCVVTTPHILTEVTNLVGQLPTDEARDVRLVLRELIPQMSEMCPASRSLAESSSFLQFGLTDTAISEVSPNEYLVVTDDLPLYHFLAGTGVDVINFNHLRPLGL